MLGKIDTSKGFIIVTLMLHVLDDAARFVGLPFVQFTPVESNIQMLIGVNW